MKFMKIPLYSLQYRTFKRLLCCILHYLHTPLPSYSTTFILHYLHTPLPSYSTTFILHYLHTPLPSYSVSSPHCPYSTTYSLYYDSTLISLYPYGSFTQLSTLPYRTQPLVSFPALLIVVSISHIPETWRIGATIAKSTRCLPLERLH